MPTNYQPKRAQKRPRRRNPIPLLAAAAAVCLALIIIPSLGSGPAQSAGAQSPEVPRTLPSASPTPEATPTPTPTPEPTPTPVPALDFTQPVPESEEVEMDYFSDALFIGDSRTDGLRLYSGIQGADFDCYKGLTIFEVDERKIVELDLNDADLVMSPYYYMQQNDILYVTPNKAKAKNSDIGNTTTTVISATSILVSIASLVVNIVH